MAALLTGLVSLGIQDRWRTQAQILPAMESRNAQGMGQLAAAAAAMGIMPSSGDGGELNYVDILNSRRLREELLATRFSFQYRKWRLGHPVQVNGTLHSFLKVRTMDQALMRLVPMIQVSRDLKTKIISISVETPSPELSRQMADRLIELLDSFLIEKGRTRASIKADFTGKRLEDAREAALCAKGRLQGFLERNRNFAASADPSVRLQGTSLEMEWKLREQLVTSLALNHEQALIDEKNDMPLLNVMDRPYLPEEKSGPSRFKLMLQSFILFAFAMGCWENRSLVKKWLVHET
jgi:hypothetical protein